MAREEMKRLTADVSTIQQAMRLDKPYAASDVPMLLLLALGGILAIPLLEFTELDNRVCVLIALAPALVQYWRLSTQRKRDQAIRPGLWQEIKLSLIVAAIALPFIFGWLIWSEMNGVPWSNTRAAVVFFLGVATVVVGLLDRNRRSYLASGIALLVYGLAIPSLTHDQAVLGGTFAMIVTGLGGAAAVRWQLKRDAIETSGSEQLG